MTFITSPCTQAWICVTDIPRSFSSFWSETVPDVLSHAGLPSNPLNWKHFCKNAGSYAAPKCIIRKVIMVSEPAASSRAGERIQSWPDHVVCRPLHRGPSTPGASLPAVCKLQTFPWGPGKQISCYSECRSRSAPHLKIDLGLPGSRG